MSLSAPSPFLCSIRQNYVYLCFAVFFLQFFDAFSTLYLIRTYGISGERNFIMRYLISLAPSILLLKIIVLPLACFALAKIGFSTFGDDVLPMLFISVTLIIAIVVSASPLPINLLSVIG